MRTISDTISRLAAFRAANAAAGETIGCGRLTPLVSFGSNPGALRGYVYIPASLAPNAALVVVLHGCTQSASGYDAGAGWSEMAERHGFALLFPEQQRQNNPNLCFNWFSPADNQRNVGEALSVRQMIAAVTAAQQIDPARIFVTGLSAGGAMTSVMLATYPEVFAGGAIIAGLPFGCASTVPEAFDRMRGHGMPGGAALSGLVRSASTHRGPWPTISIWHGTADATVSYNNAQAIVDQWRDLHGVTSNGYEEHVVSGHARRVWADASGREVIEEYTIRGMGHGTPVDTLCDDGCGASGAYMLEANISSTLHICHFWGLAKETPAAPRAPAPELVEVSAGSAEPKAVAMPLLHSPVMHRSDKPPVATHGVRQVIEHALRQAGLMK